MPEASDSPAIPHLNDVDFDLAVQATSGPTVVCFEAAWCAACRTQVGVLQQLLRERDATLAFRRVDVDKSPQTAQRFGIVSLPTLIWFEQGQPVSRLVGLHGREASAAWFGRRSHV